MEWVLWAYRQLYWCKRQIVKQCCPREVLPYRKLSVNSSSLPWLWIGIQYNDQTTVTVTEIVNHAIEYGDHITPVFLTTLCGFSGGTWKYVDSKTLEELDFPSEGFIIKNDRPNTVSHSE